MPVGLELARLVGAPAGDQRERRPVRAHDLELLGAQLGGHEAEHADAPGALAEQLARCAPAARRPRAPRISASARNGSAPPSATAAANSARSLTRVIGPCTIG